MLRWRHFLDAQPIALRKLRESRAAFVRLVVLALLVKRQEAVKHRDRASGAERDLAVVGNGIDGRALEFSAFHLARQRPLPDQFIEARLIGIEFARDLLGPPQKARRTDGLMRFLRILGPADIGARRIRQISRTEIVANEPACFG